MARSVVVFLALSAVTYLIGCSASTGQHMVATSNIGETRAPDGVEIRYEVAGRGEPAMVFVHGWSCDRTYWREQFRHFAKSHRVVAVDLGGHGESGAGRANWTMAAFGGDVCAVVDALGPRRVVLVGHSMGGPVILEAAQQLEVNQQAAGRVAAVIPVDSLTVVAPVEDKARFVSAFRDDFRGATQRMVREHLFGPGTDPEMIDRIAADMSAAPPAVGLSAMENLLNYPEGPSLAEVKAPVRLINADLWPTDLATWRRHKPGVTVAVMPGVGHFPMLEQPEEFNRLLERAVRDLTKR